MCGAAPVRIELAGLTEELGRLDDISAESSRDVLLSVVRRPQLRIIVERFPYDDTRFVYLFAVPTLGVVGRVHDDALELEPSEPYLLPFELARLVGLRTSSRPRNSSCPKEVPLADLEATMHARFPCGWLSWRVDSCWVDREDARHSSELIVADAGPAGSVRIERNPERPDTVSMCALTSREIWTDILGLFPFSAASRVDRSSGGTV
jgi:hypothetical protein